jgi:hypothetical protein
VAFWSSYSVSKQIVALLSLAEWLLGRQYNL